MKASWKKHLQTFWRGWGYSILIAFLVATSFKSAIADWNIVPTGSMKPTIVEGDRIFVNKLAYDLKVPYTTWHLARWGDPQRGEVVVFYSPQDGQRLVKRVVGLPGDTIALVDNRLFVNGIAMTYEHMEPPADSSTSKDPALRFFYYTENLTGRQHPIRTHPGGPAFRSFAPIVIPEGMYFMMGDNRDNSADSRFFGFVKRRLIVGRATAIVASLDKSRWYRPRWDRFFTCLP